MLAERIYVKLQILGTRQVRFHRGMLLTYPYPAPFGYGTRGQLVGIYTINANLKWIEEDVFGVFQTREMQIDPNLINLKEVKAMARLGKTQIYERIKIGTFPAPIKVGLSAVRWNRGDIERWVITNRRAKTNRSDTSSCDASALSVSRNSNGSRSVAELLGETS